MKHVLAIILAMALFVPAASPPEAGGLAARSRRRVLLDTAAGSAVHGAAAALRVRQR